MWTAICVVVGIVVVFGGFAQIGTNKYYPLTLMSGALLVLLGLTFDPVGFLTSKMRDERLVDDRGQGNYWVELRTGDMFHKEDDEVRACNQLKYTIPVWNTQLEVCPIFGDGPSLLYDGRGPILEMARTMKTEFNYQKPAMIWPGRWFTITAAQAPMNQPRFGCFIPYSPDGRRLIRPGMSGLVYEVLDKGEWKRIGLLHPGKDDKVYTVSAVRYTTPDNLPRPVIRQYQEPRYINPRQLKHSWFCLK